MGEAKRKKESTFAKLKASNCIFCGGGLAAGTVDHIPPKVFFINKLRPNSHEVPACARCNSGSKASDQIAALTCLTMASTRTDSIPKDYFLKLVRGVRNNQPDVIRYLSGLESHPLYQSKLLHLPPYAYKIKVDERLWTQYLNIWAAKQAMAIYYLEVGQPLTEKGIIYVNWYTNFQLSEERYPKDLISLLDGYSTLSKGAFEVSEQFEYRFEPLKDPAGLVMTMGMHRSAIVLATVFADAEQVPPDSNIASLNAYRTNAELGIHFVEKQE